jgi:hypothetical protein
MATPFVELFTENDPATLETELFETLEEQFEGWDPAAEGLAVWLSKAFIRIASSVFDLASIVSREAFKTFGETIVNVPPIRAAPATAQSTWKATDTDGHKIPAGTVVTITSEDVVFGFRTVGVVVIDPGSDETAAGAVLLEAVAPGDAYNGLTAAPELSSSLSFIDPDGIVLTGPTSGGVDAESEDAYLARLTEELQTLTLSAVLLRDYPILARRVAGVARATALDNYDPVAEEFEVPLVVTVAVHDVLGAALSEGVKEEAKTLLKSRSLSNIETHVIDPTFTEVGVKAKVAFVAGYDPVAVVAAVDARLSDYLASAKWGQPDGNVDPGNSAGWENKLVVYVNEVLAEVDRVPGVSRVESVELSKNGGAFAKANVELDGPAALTKPGTIEVTEV